MCERLQEKAKKRKPKKPKYHAEGPVLDAFKNEVPKHLWDVWLDPWLQKTYDSLCLFSEEFRREDMIEGMRKRAKFLPFMMDRDFKDGCGMIIHTLDQLIEHIKQTRPAGVCPACNGEKCGQCLMSGLVPRGLYEQIKAKAAQDSDGEIAGIETLDDLDQSVSQAG